jgi:hypothetical protein
MRRTTLSRRRGRPEDSRRLFVEDCTRVDATLMLAKSRGHDLDDDLAALPLTFSWTEYGQTHVRQVRLPVTTTVQPLGGVRRWWRCPTCNRRCRILLVWSKESGVAVACRRCLGAVYASDYPARDNWRQMAAFLTGYLGDGSIIGIERCSRELSVLLAKRRRGVRRGRRLTKRAWRLLVRLRQEPDAITSLFAEYERTMPPKSSGLIARATSESGAQAATAPDGEAS